MTAAVLPNTVEGVVEAISVKALEAEDRFGNKYRRSFKVNGEWFSLGNSTVESINASNGQVTKGAQVAFTFKQNGDFKNAALATMVVQSAGQAPSAAPAAKPAATKSTKSDSYTLGIEIGHAINNGTQIAIARAGAEVTTAEIELAAREILELATQLKTEAALD